MNADLIDNGGILLVNKPSGITSHDVVGKIRKLYGTRKVGHTGTLDPMATGLMAVLIGRAVKASDLIVSDDKRYIAGMRLGITTDTADITGNILSRNDFVPDRCDVINTVNSFVGRYMQVPPMYSAIKIGGKKLYELAREGKTVEIEPRELYIYKIGVEGDTRDYTLDVHCSKGTYIRTLCEDIGKKLGCGAVMSSLCRVSTGSFSLHDAKTLDEIEQMTIKQRKELLIPVENLFLTLPSVALGSFYTKLCLNGCEIYQKKIGTSFDVDEKVRVYSDGVFLGLGEVKNYPDGTAVKLAARFV
ncbi:MAG: tRNA pseudouridine(55) synthase TruB [Clostridia bacterium]|nr:tRNA pseudouridine(55) synthase TruB [Clostridia bacterium]